MLHLDPKNPSSIDTDTFSKSLLAFKPRQVLLAQHNPRTTMTASVLKEESSSKITSLTPESKATLHESIIHYLHRNGFSKTLKRFQSEAQIQNDTWKASSIHLEDIFCKYNACSVDSNKSTGKKPVLGNDEAINNDNVCSTNEETTTKKKKKKGTIKSDNGAIKDQSEVIDAMVESVKNCGQISEEIIQNELETKPKKKKTRHDLDSSCEAVDDTINGSKIDDSIKKMKEKKKKSIQQDKLEACITNENELATEVVQKEKKKKKRKAIIDSAIETDTENEKKSSKKRKRLTSDENEIIPTEMTNIEESKRQKTETFKKEKSKKEGSEVNEVNAQETSNKQFDEHTNGKLEINGEKSSAQKSTKKERNAIAELRTVNAFQRVKIDQVEFAHEKLQDNSYWAKDGADIGYGAKAQEVLGQVRGRDFRHEKTKKKRGSYRGGLIDLQSHSIKFNYSDEE